MKKMTLATATLTALIAASTTTSVFAADPQIEKSTGKVNVTSETDPDKQFTLDAVPDIDFGDAAVGQTKSAETISSDLQTTDLRATGEGWDVTIQYADEAGAVLTDGTQAWKNGSTLGKGFEMALAAPTYSGTGAPTTTSAATVNTEAQKIVVAKADTTGAAAEGLGTWKGSFDKTATKITIPSNNVKGEYTSQLLWTLESTPTA